MYEVTLVSSARADSVRPVPYRWWEQLHGRSRERSRATKCGRGSKTQLARREDGRVLQFAKVVAIDDDEVVACP